MSDSQYRWDLKIVFIEGVELKPLEKKIFDLEDKGDGYVKLIMVDRFDKEGNPHVTYQSFNKSHILCLTMTERDRPTIIAPSGIITN